MVNVIELNAVKREKAGKGASRALRRAGNIPCVIYGDKKAPVMIAIAEKDLVAQLAKRGFWTHQFEINADGEKIRTICQDVQYHVLTDRPVHADFLRISKDAKLTMEIPLRFLNEEAAVGIKNGGVLNIVHRSVEVLCSADNIPEAFELDIAQMAIGDVMTTAQLSLPAGVQLVDEEEKTLVTIAEPTKEKVDVETATENAEAATPAEEK